MNFLLNSFSRFQAFESVCLWYIQNKWRTPKLDTLMYSASLIGNLGFIWILFLGLLLLYGTREAKLLSFCIFLGLCLHVLLCNIILKPFIARERPIGFGIKNLLTGLKDYSFPSGHTCSSFVVLSIFQFWNSALFWITLPIACIISFSRLYLGVHYPSDIIAGMILGYAIGHTSCVIAYFSFVV